MSGCPAAHLPEWFSLGHRTPEWLCLHCLHPGLCLNLFHTLALPPGLPWPCPLVICLWFPSQLLRCCVPLGFHTAITT